jgi:hypothetical protein
MELNHPVNWLSAIGLLFDIVGIITLFYTGAPEYFEQFNRTRQVFTGNILLEEEEEPETSKTNWKDSIAKLSVWLIVFGFVLQLAGTIVKIK